MPVSLKIKKGDILLENSSSLKDLNKLIANKVIPKIYQNMGYLEAV